MGGPHGVKTILVTRTRFHSSSSCTYHSCFKPPQSYPRVGPSAASPCQHRARFPAVTPPECRPTLPVRGIQRRQVRLLLVIILIQSRSLTRTRRWPSTESILTFGWSNSER
jgi:hypothetical protein